MILYIDIYEGVFGGVPVGVCVCVHERENVGEWNA